MLTYEDLTKSDAIRTYIIRADESLTALAEVTGDGKITAADARTILRVSAKLESFK